MASPASSDEGEINESAPQHSKATTSHRSGGTMVDLQDRSRGRYSNSRSPDRYDSDRRRHAAGPPRRSSRSPRGFKRGRDDRDSYHGSGRGGGDPRQFRGHYEDRDGYSYRSRALPYEDLDRPTGGGYRYDSDRDRQQRDRGSDRYADKRPRHARSRSPPGRRGGGGGGRGGGRDDRSRRERDYVNGGHSEAIKYDQHERDPRDQSKRAALSQPSTVSTHDAKTAKGSADDLPTADAVTTQQESAPAPQPEPEPEPEVEEEQPIDEDAEIERRRRRREEILARSRQETPLLVQALQPKAISAVSSPGHIQDSTPRRTEANTPREGTPDIGRLLGVVEAADRRATESPALSTTGPQDGDSPHAIEISNDQELINLHGNARSSEEDGPSAADYDPTVDMKEDGRRDELRHGNVGLHGEPKVPETVLQSIEQETVETATAAKSEDDDFDMFAEDFDEEKYTAPKPPRAAASSKAIEEATLPPVVGNAGGILEGDDKDGYYKIRIGEILNGRYQVQSTLGKGMFSSVARAVDITNKKLVAIKIMRNNDALRKGGFTEIAILQKLNEADPENRKHIVKFERHFDHKGHLCMAFENLSLNLREVLRKFGNNIGINLNATRAYAHQIFVALAHLKKCSIIHADLKPDNILVNETRNVLKICDLGTAIDRSDAATSLNEMTPYLVSRYYRAPEIILGIPYDYAIDMWSIGCTLYELYTGKILFAGDSNNQMLKAIMEIRGKFSAKLYRRGQLSHHHFDEMGNFISVERDKALGKTTVRTIPVIKPTRDLRTRLVAASSGMSDVEARDLNHFADLLDRCLALNPDKRITPVEALKHPFFSAGKVGSSGR